MYEPGKQYRVLKPSRIEGLKHLGGSSFQPEVRSELNVGDIIEVVGYRGGFGDSPDILNVKNEQGSGEFEPNSWGTPVPGYLEEVPE